ncbi:hypothetical protein [Actinoplanes sp. HUAS TT8]|uniref:hypothetical protein n=1 Tax=Actinoplanes sp. HUAS TT8 TaxID=3447453 RepID=UPI003F5219D2
MTDTVRDVVCHYYDPVKAPLLRGAVLPGLRAVVPEAVSAHLERGWRHGPHLRIRLSGPARPVETAADRLAGRVRAYLSEHPSRTRLSEEDLLTASIAAGRAELVAPPYEPFRPDNTVLVVASDPSPVRALVLAAGTDAVEATLDRTAEDGDDPAARVRAAVVALTAVAAGGPWGLRGNYLSYLSHVEAYLWHEDPDGRIRALHDRVWRRQADPVTALVSRLGGLGPDPAGAPGPAEAGWHDWGVRARRAATAARDRGDLRSTTGEDLARRALALDAPALRRWHDPGTVSDFHRSIGLRERDPGEQRLFDVERFCANMLYLLLAVCDITPAERYLASALVCAATERITGRTWRDVAGPDPRSRR